MSRFRRGLESLSWAFRRPPHLIITCARYLIEPARRAVPQALQESQWIEAVPNAVDLKILAGDKRDASAAGRGRRSATPLALMLANLAPHKGQETAIKSVAILKQAGIELNCWLAGVEREGCTEYTYRLKALIAELNVGDQRPGCSAGEDDGLSLLLRAADFFLLPSTHEGLPLSIVEAQASKVPVLAAPTAGIPEVVADGETGFLIAADDASGYAHRIGCLLENPMIYHRVAVRATERTISALSRESHCGRLLESLSRTARTWSTSHSSGTDPQFATNCGTSFIGGSPMNRLEGPPLHKRWEALGLAPGAP